MIKKQYFIPFLSLLLLKILFSLSSFALQPPFLSLFSYFSLLLLSCLPPLTQTLLAKCVEIRMTMIGDDVDVLWRLRLATVLAFKVVGFCGFCGTFCC